MFLLPTTSATGKCIELKIVAFYSTLTVMNMRKYMKKSVWVKSYQDDYAGARSFLLPPLLYYGRKYPEPKSFNRSLISLHRLFTWRFLWSNFPKSNSQKPKTSILKKLEVHFDRGEASIYTCQPLFYSWGTGNSLLVSHRKEKDTFALIMTVFLKYEVILQYKLFTLLDIPTQYRSTQKV